VGIDRKETLRWGSSADLTIHRRRNGRGFVYVDTEGRRIIEPRELQRIRALAIPPAYTEVLISSDSKSHLQATGRDAAGRIQYRYHPDWEHLREKQKELRIATLCRVLPQVRRTVARHLRASGVGRERVLAAVVTLIDRTHVRIGSADYVHSGRSRGASTLLKRNVRRAGKTLHLTFRGKGGKQVETEVTVPGLARLYSSLQRLPGAQFFQFRDADGSVKKVTARQVNEYLTAIAGVSVSAKDFRTLAASAMAAAELSRLVPQAAKARRAQIAAVLDTVAGALCNTPAVVRSSYVHARVIEAFESGSLQDLQKRFAKRHSLTLGESLVAALCRGG
jgi:DNA topoisomerase-1